MSRRAPSRSPKTTDALKRARQPRELTRRQADLALAPDNLPKFQTTADVEPLDEIIGQHRAMRALESGLGITQEGYNIFVAGLTGTGKMETIRKSLQQRLKDSAVPNDWVYVHNFDQPDEPSALRLPAGWGRRLKRDLQRLVERLQEELPKAFRHEDFSQEKEQLGEKYQNRFQRQVQQLAEQAKERGFELREGPGGALAVVPLIDGQPPQSEEQLAQLSEEDRKRIAEGQKELSREAARILRNQREWLGELSEEVKGAERKFGSTVVEPRLQRLREIYREHPRVLGYLDRVAAHILEHLSDFREGGQKQMMPGPLPGLVMVEDHQPRFTEYQVNVVVDHGSSEGAPVIVEEYPTYKNLFGTIDRVIEPTGRVITNFTQIKAGSLLRASGGYLVFNLDDALTEPLVYKNLKRVLKTSRLKFEVYEPLALFSTGSLRPEAIPIRTKVVAIGSPWLYLLLRCYDDEFAAIFKIKAEFGTEMDRGKDEQWWYARFVSMLARQEQLHPFSRDAVTEVIRFGARHTSQQGKLLTRFSEVADLLREANFCAVQDGKKVVDAAHIRRALEDRVYRGDRIARKIRELIAEGTILIDTRDRRVGQVNGLAVTELGDYAFGRPTRVTAAVGLGSEGVVNIEREAKLSGSTHDKGVLILTGYLHRVFGQDKPLALTASVCFEQSYGGVDGDSASSTELYALLSVLANVPLRQDIAVTGSINQWGQIQAIGGINEKIEGFYDVCRAIGLTGSQGVCLPASNVRNLVLRPDVLDAIADGQFHLYPIETVEEGLELLSGVRAGRPGTKDTFLGRVDQRLRAMAEGLRDFASQASRPSVLTVRQEIPPHLPPRAPGDNP